MASRALSALCLLAAGALSAEQGGTARERSLEAAWAQELMPDLTPETKKKAYVSPTKRVVNLLSKMKAELKAEADKEAEMYERMVCWCETNEKEKKQAIVEAEAKDVQLTSEIEARSAKFGELAADIANTKQEVAENTEALKTATSIREGEAEKFRGEENDMVQAVTNLRNAIAVLAKHQTTQAFLQLDRPVLSGMRVLLRDAALKYELLVAGRAERRGTAPGVQPAALLSLSSESKRLGGGGAAQSISAALLSALELQDSESSEVLPLKFAARLVARAARPGSSGSPAASRGQAFLQVEAAQPLYESRSSARSAGIYGVLTQMLAEFEAELSSAQKEELQAQEDFRALVAAKTAEIDAGKLKRDEMEAMDAGNRKALSDAKGDLTVTREERDTDVKFMQNLKLTCNDLDAQWEKRSKTRAAETQAVAEAIAILTQDDNREVLAKSVTLLQRRSGESASAELRARRASAVALLRRAAGEPSFQADDLLAAWHGRRGATLGAAAGPRTQLSTLAMAVQLDAFTKVKEMMDTMVVQLKKQQEEEVQFKAYCTTELDTNEKTTYDKSQLKASLEAKIQQLATLIEQLEGEVAHAKADIATAQSEIKKASQAREEENAEFQTIVADQRATQSILQKALMKLKDFYVKGIGKAVLAQRGAQTPPEQFNSYKTNAAAPPVIGLIEQILEDSKALEVETTAGEYKAQADYETFVGDSNNVIQSLEASITEKSKAVAAANSDTAQAKSDLGNTEGELESLAAYEADLHNECDFVLKNFDVRQTARLQEIEAIQAAKAILSGAK